MAWQRWIYSDLIDETSQDISRSLSMPWNLGKLRIQGASELADVQMLYTVWIELDYNFMCVWSDLSSPIQNLQVSINSGLIWVV